ncbi:MAG: phosphoribosylformylglycinamidine cyclo-ligase [Fusobacteria bacterium]|nr:MAG: phosphoribosylformylglycinamidine cyclo-ligase [Fusobacteriota bacterium]KAF0229233.1 MAG: phosphoribosylformylglycinamidine [Fusobacteriota bacterium]
MKSFSDSYKAAGVDVTAGYEGVELIKEHVKRTKIPGVLSDLGGFAGLFQPDIKNMEEPVLVSGTDGVGTKLKLAFSLNKHDTVGIDCVAMCVNDIICCGATPLFFLDYIAVGKNVPTRIEKIVSGIAEGCIQAGCALVGGETAEMPGFYPEDEYDLAGFAVGMVDKKKILDPSTITSGDIIIGVPSSGLHSNGFSLVRKTFENDDLNEYREDLGASLADTLITPTKIYVKEMLKLQKEVSIKSLCHITGGGLYENIPRALPPGYSAKIYKEAIPKQPIFKLLQKKGNIPEKDMYNTFNMGLGMCAIVAPENAATAVQTLKQTGLNAFEAGVVIKDLSGVEIC